MFYWESFLFLDFWPYSLTTHTKPMSQVLCSIQLKGTLYITCQFCPSTFSVWSEASSREFPWPLASLSLGKCRLSGPTPDFLNRQVWGGAQQCVFLQALHVILMHVKVCEPLVWNKFQGTYLTMLLSRHSSHCTFMNDFYIRFTSFSFIYDIWNKPLYVNAYYSFSFLERMSLSLIRLWALRKLLPVR